MSEDARRPAGRLRSQEWFDNPDDPGMTALYIERYMNYGLTREELQSGKPIIGIAQTGSDLSPCNRHHLELAERVRDGIREAGGIADRVPGPPDPGDRQAADRGAGPQPRLPGAGRGAVRLPARWRGADHRLRQDHAGVPDGRGDGRTSRRSCCPAGRCSNGWYKGELAGSGTIVWKARKHARRRRDRLRASSWSWSPPPRLASGIATRWAPRFDEQPGRGARHVAARLRRHPGPYRERGQMAYVTGRRIVEMVHENLKPSDILTREAFENAIVATRAIGGSTNAPIHIIAIARHMGVELDDRGLGDGRPRHPAAGRPAAGRRFLGEAFHRAGGVPAVMNELLRARKLVHDDAMTVTGTHHRRELPGRGAEDREVIRAYDKPMMAEGRLRHAVGQPLRQRGHEDQRHRRRSSASAISSDPATRTSSRAGRSCSRGRRTTTTASRTRRSGSTSIACWSSATPARSAIPAAPRW